MYAGPLRLLRAFTVSATCSGAQARALSKFTDRAPNESQTAGTTKVSRVHAHRFATATLAVAMVAGTAGCGAADMREAPNFSPAPILASEHKTAGGDPGVELYLREKRAIAEPTISKGKVVIFLEPFGVPTAKAFDVPGLSWMDSLAGAGYDTWALDFRGFGQSSRPPETSSTAEAVRDLDAAVSFITKQAGVDKVSLVGWSWGGVVGGAYAAAHPTRVDKLVLHGAMHGFSLPMMTTPLESAPGVRNPLPAYQLAPFNLTEDQWKLMMAGRPLATPASIEAVRQVFLAADPTSGTRTPASVRRAMGPMVDLYSIWSDKPIYDAAKITAPVLVIAGDADSFADPTLFCKLTKSTDRREVIIPEATHWVLYESHRDVLLSETEKFLGAAHPSAHSDVPAKCKG